MAEENEKIYVIPLKKKGFKTSNAAPKAIKRVKNFLIRHMKVESENIWIDDSLNNAIWSHGKYKMPNKIRVKAVKFDDGVVEAYLPELEFKKSRRELLKEEREKKEPILVKEEKEMEGEPGEVPGAQDYEISPTTDGEVKIKKKKATKDKVTEKKKKPSVKKEKIDKHEKKIKEKSKTKKEKSKPKTVKKGKSQTKTNLKGSQSKKVKKESK